MAVMDYIEAAGGRVVKPIFEFPKVATFISPTRMAANGPSGLKLKAYLVLIESKRYPKFLNWRVSLSWIYGSGH